MSHEPTDEQIAINKFIADGKGHLLIDALAGSGKTSTLIDSLKSLPQKSALMCAFNKAIATELTERMGQPPKGSMWKSATFHSLGLKIVTSHRPRLDVRPEATEDLINDASQRFELDVELNKSLERVPFGARRAAVWLLRMFKETHTERKVSALQMRSFGEANDLHQAIYGWRGAVGHEVWKEMREGYKATQLPLTTTFRCSSAVVKQANEIVPALRARKGAAAGSVQNCSFQDLANRLRVAWNIPTFVLSRNNADLLHTALLLWKADVGFSLLAGREIVEPLYEIIDKLDKSTKARFSASLTTWHQAEMSKAEKAHGAAWADRIDQQYESLLMMLGYAEPSKFHQILADLVNIGGMSAITLSTVHKVKGLEAERVYLLKQTFSRHRYRQQIEEALDDWERNRARERLANIDPEELHLEYVAVTRAKLDLIWVDMRGASAETLAKLVDVEKK